MKLIVALALAVWPHIALAQVEKPKPDLAPADLAIPESAAFTVLGITPAKVTKPGTLPELAAGVANGVDSHGKLQNGVAIDVNPFRMIYGNRLLLENFKDPVIGTLARTSLSLATTTEAASKTGHAAVGIHFAVIDLSDPHNDPDLITCLKTELDKIPLPTTPTIEKPKIVISAEVKKAVQDCRDAFAERVWNRTSWTVAAASAHISSDTTAQNLKSDGGGVWSSFAYGFEQLGKDNWWYQHAQLIVHAHARNGEHVTDENKVTTDHDRRLYGTRLRIGSANRNGSLELTHETDRTAANRSRRNAAVLSLEQKLFEGVWLQVALGREQVHGGDGTGIVARSTFHWQFNQKKND